MWGFGAGCDGAVVRASLLMGLVTRFVLRHCEVAELVVRVNLIDWAITPGRLLEVEDRDPLLEQGQIGAEQVP
jgi:hypothetical protein